MNRILAGIALVLAATCGLLLWGYNRELKRSSELQTAVDTYTAIIASREQAHIQTVAAMNSRLAAARKEAQRTREERDALNKALAASPEWSDQPVPAGVADWLRQPGGGDPR